MARVWFTQTLETVAVWWRVLRRDGVALGFTTHDADLWFDGVCHCASPGIVPSAIRREAGLTGDSAEAEGALTSEAITAADLTAGRYDGALVIAGLVDWETLETTAIFSGTMGAVSETDLGFATELLSRKRDLGINPIPHTSPSCRADFCGPGCGLSAARFTHEAVLTGQDSANNAVALSCAAPPANLVGGTLRWLDGPYAGIAMTMLALITPANGANELVLDAPLDLVITPGARAIASEGCDHTLNTCATRFANAINFQGEPYLPGNDLIVRYGLQ